MEMIVLSTVLIKNILPMLQSQVFRSLNLSKATSTQLARHGSGGDKETIHCNRKIHVCTNIQSHNIGALQVQALHNTTRLN